MLMTSVFRLVPTSVGLVIGDFWSQPNPAKKLQGLLAACWKRALTLSGHSFWSSARMPSEGSAPCFQQAANGGNAGQKTNDFRSDGRFSQTDFLV